MSRGGVQLAMLYRAKGKDQGRAMRMLDNLVKANPKSVAVRLARYRFFLSQPDASAANAKRAAEEINEAIRLAPKDAETRLIAAEFAAQRGETALARAHLAAIDPPPKNDLRVKLVTGLIELREQRPDDAIQSWRTGLALTGGSDAELTWRLARVLLAMGRVVDAEPLMRHYHFLTGNGEPRPEYRYLMALAHLRKGRANEAIAELEAIRLKVDKSIAAQHMITLGDAYVVIRDDAKALAAYKAAATMPRAGSQPRLSMARIQLNERPAEAIDSLELGPARVAGRPGLALDAGAGPVAGRDGQAGQGPRLERLQPLHGPHRGR